MGRRANVYLSLVYATLRELIVDVFHPDDLLNCFAYSLLNFLLIFTR